MQALISVRVARSDSVSAVYENGQEHPMLHEVKALVFSGGTGDSNDPYLIAATEQLISIADDPALLDQRFALAHDIDLSGVTWSSAVIPNFNGSLNGNGFAIQNLKIEGESYLGLFGKLDAGASIYNLDLEEVGVYGTADHVGGLAGSNGDWENAGGVLTNCHISGTVTGNDTVGGLVGESSGSITACCSTSTVCGTGWRVVGGLVGGNRDNITTSYSAAMVSGNRGVGGLAGWNEGNLSNCYSTGTVGGDMYVGGLVGESDDGSITMSFSAGTVTGNRHIGGLVGANGGVVTMSFWDMENSRVFGSAGGVGLTTAEMMDPYTLSLNGLGGNPHWTVDTSRDYPRLTWEGAVRQFISEPVIDWLTGTGSAEDPYCIETSAQLIMLGKGSILWGRHFLLCADLDLDPNLPGQYVFGQALIPSFSGFFDGNGHVISNLCIKGSSHLGLFGRLAHGAEVKGLGLAHMNIMGTGEYVGGLAGSNLGGIVESYSSGQVTGDYAVGGLVAANTGSITSSYNSGTVTGNDAVFGLVGGLAAANTGSVTSSYSSGMVSGNGNIGGLVGGNRGNITTSYSAAIVSGNDDVGGLVGYTSRRGSISRSFWDIQTSDQTNMCGRQGEDATGCDDSFGLSTAEMQDVNTYLNAGRYFADETNNGIWWIDDGQDYPRLWWEMIPEN